MREEENTYELIERYLNKELSGSELEAFEKELSSNAGLQQKVKLHKMANELVIENRLLQVKEILQEQKPSGGNSSWRNISIATAGIALVTSLFFFFKEEKKQISSERVAVKTSEPDTELSPAAEENKPAEKKTERKVYSNEKTTFTPQVNAVGVTEEEKEENKTEEPVISTEPIKTTEEKTTEEDRPEENRTTPTTPKDICESIQITAEVQSNAACPGEDNGSILINHIKGGHGPYKVYVYDSNQELQVSYLDLPAGTYSAEIKDSKGCIKKLNELNVKEKTCPKEYSFNPFTGETWNIPSAGKEGKLYIYNDKGNVYYEKDLSAGAEEQWSGQSGNGDLVDGYYLFVIKYKDGTQLQGSVTIVR